MEGLAADTERTERATAMVPEEQARAGVYSLLGALFAGPPGVEVISILQTIPDAGDDSAPAMAASWRALKQAADHAPMAQIGDEYQDLFIGVGRGELLPYGSPYLTGFLHDRPLVDLREDLARLGLQRQPSSREPEDHVAALCEAMAHLISSSAEYGFDDQKGFFEKHLLPWVGQFMSDLQAAKSADFYHAVGDLGADFFALETRYFSLKT